MFQNDFGIVPWMFVCIVNMHMHVTRRDGWVGLRRFGLLDPSAMVGEWGRPTSTPPPGWGQSNPPPTRPTALGPVVDHRYKSWRFGRISEPKVWDVSTVQLKG